MRNLLLWVIMISVYLFCISPASASVWTLEADNNHPDWLTWRYPTFSDFTIEFNDSDNDNTVTVGDVISFSGLETYDNDTGVVTGSWDTVVDLLDITVSGLQLLDLNTATTGWDFSGPSGNLNTTPNHSYTATVVPLPGAVWLLGSGLIGLVGLRRKFRER
jgi:hypothetical protein